MGCVVMKDARGRDRRPDAGFATIEYVVATGLSLVMLVLVANLLVDLYARGAVRDALDEGARAGAPIDAPAGACEERAAGVLHGLLRGPVGDGVAVHCAVGPDWVIATADVRLRAWIPGLTPDWRFTAHAVTATEK